MRVASFPAGTKDANELLVSRNGDASEALRRCSMKPSHDRERAEPAATCLILLALLLVFLLLLRYPPRPPTPASLPQPPPTGH